MNLVMIFFLFWGQAPILAKPEENLILNSDEKKTLIGPLLLSFYSASPLPTWNREPFWFLYP